MGLIDRIRRRSMLPDDEFSSPVGFRIAFDEETRFVADAEALALMRDGRAPRGMQEQFYVLDVLADEGCALPLPDGFAVPAEEIVRLEDDDAEALGLPPRFTHPLHARVHQWTASPDFRIDLEVRVGVHAESPARRGPVVRAGGTLHRVSLPLLRTLRALEAHAALERPERTEAENVRLVAQVQAAQRLAAAGEAAARDTTFRFSLGALDRFQTVSPVRVGLIVEPQTDGSLTVEPDLGADVDRQLVGPRWRQLDGLGHAEPATDQATDDIAGSAAVLRVDNTLVLLEDEQLQAVREVRERPLIPAGEVPRFLEAPGSFYDPERVDVDVHFGVRVAGLGVIAPVTFNEAASSGLDWFASQTSVRPPETLAEVARTSAEQSSIESTVTDAWERGEQVVPVSEQLVDVSDRSRVEQALTASRERIEALAVADGPGPIKPETRGRQVTVGMHILDVADLAGKLRERAAQAKPVAPIDYASLRRAPFPHQCAGIEWMSGLLQDALLDTGDPTMRVQGALLADDMGLGKTLMALVALAEAHRAQAEAGRVALPTLAVMPLGLMENWLQEIVSTFGTAMGPFPDVVVLHGPGLADYRLRGAGPETAASVEDLDEHGMVRQDRIFASLRVGSRWGDSRLDRPGVLVLTTYETLRRYQVSLGLVEWGVVVFDEAQATKNPETLVTRAAKALKSRFKLLATGTPVENSLRDFWSLIDTAQPGLLGTWAEFQQAWVEPISAAEGDEHERLGRALRDAVGEFMLRRSKEDHLENLPPKRVHEYRRTMPSVQAQAYDEAIGRYRQRAGIQGAALKSLHELGAVSLHPGLLSGGVTTDVAAIDHSARTMVAVREVLDGVRGRDEKAIIFAKTKELQRALAVWLTQVYGLRVHIVNGDTAATGSGSETRLAKIRDFEAVAGFNVILMSPLAVGVGLTVVGANHAIHLERHWNPAKEAQATDRIYRIGQTREVHVHYPIALHPTLDSFDVNLDRLLRTKVALKDAVVVPQQVEQAEMERALGLS
jgi:hypothetical protein